MKRLLAHALSEAGLRFVVGALVVVTVVVLAGYELPRYLRVMDATLAGLGPWGVLAFVGIFAVATSLLLPEAVMAFAAGALFGLVGGFFTAFVGAFLGAIVQYWLSRHLLHRPVERMLGHRPSLAAIQRAVMKDQLRLQALVRLTPLNPATVSYLLGASGIRFGNFCIAFLAVTPHLFIEVYFGYASKHVVLLASRAARVHDAVVLGGLVVAILVILRVSQIAHKAVQEAVAGVEDLPGEGTAKVDADG